MRFRLLHDGKAVVCPLVDERIAKRPFEDKFTAIEGTLAELSDEAERLELDVSKEMHIRAYRAQQAEKDAPKVDYKAVVAELVKSGKCTEVDVAIARSALLQRKKLMPGTGRIDYARGTIGHGTVFSGDI